MTIVSGSDSVMVQYSQINYHYFSDRDKSLFSMLKLH